VPYIGPPEVLMVLQHGTGYCPVSGNPCRKLKRGRFQVMTAVSVIIQGSWDVTTCQMLPGYWTSYELAAATF